MKFVLIFLTLLFCLSAVTIAAQNPADGSDFGIFIHENPANERAEIDILIPEPGEIRVLIYDNQGNVLFSKRGSTQRAGNANLLQITWDLNARSNGRRVAAGTYIVQATAQSAITTQIFQYFAQLGVRR